MERSILLLGREKTNKKNLAEIIAHCELPESALVQVASYQKASSVIVDHTVWLIIVNAPDINGANKFLRSLQHKNELIPTIVICAVETKGMEVLLALGACEVIDPAILTPTVLTQSVLSAVERKRIEADLISTDAIMKAINYAAEVFLLHLDWDTRINEVLERFGNGSRADKVCIYRNQIIEDGVLESQLHAGWVSDASCVLESTQAVLECERKGYLNSRWLENLRNGESVIGRPEDFLPADQPALQKRNIQSLAVIPIFSDKVWWGFMTFEHCRIKKLWTPDEIKALHTAARIFSAGISRVDAETRLTHLATHDFLTNLPNRMLLEDRFEQAIARAERSKKKFGIVALDLDKFKQINDTYGHPFGDKVLVEIAWRLAETIRTSDTCARVGGDEFTVLAEGINSKRDLVRVMEKLTGALAESIQIEGRSVKVTASMAASIYPNHGMEMESLMKAADVALYQVKESYSGHRIFSPARQISLIEEE